MVNTMNETRTYHGCSNSVLVMRLEGNSVFRARGYLPAVRPSHLAMTTAKSNLEGYTYESSFRALADW
jgi:hypothetical protein